MLPTIRNKLILKDNCFIGTEGKKDDTKSALFNPAKIIGEGNNDKALTARNVEKEMVLDEDALMGFSLRHLLQNTMHRGSDVRIVSGVLTRPDLWPRRSIQPSRYHWKVVLSYGASGDHINVAELKAILAAIRWRTRSAANIASRCIHLSDSQVSISVLVKGRSSSVLLQRVLHRLNCLVLATALHIAHVFVRTDLNPADKPSRWPKQPA